MQVRKRIKKLISKVDLLYYEKLYCKQYKIIVGVDEVGRGALAGPIYAAAVVLPNLSQYSYKDLAKQLYGIFDSKQLSSEERQYYYQKIVDVSVYYAIGRVSVDIVNQLNPHHASHQAIVEALKKLPAFDIVLVDGSFKIKWLQDNNIEQVTIVSGDAKSLSIAAASIIAKVERDKEMIELSKRYPQYKFDSNKGYYCRDHLRAIQQFGLTDQHRINYPILKRLNSSNC